MDLTPLESPAATSGDDGCSFLSEPRWKGEDFLTGFHFILQKIKPYINYNLFKNQPFDFPRSKTWGLPLGLSSGRRLMVDTERRFSSRPKGWGLGAVGVSIPHLKNQIGEMRTILDKAVSFG